MSGGSQPPRVMNVPSGLRVCRPCLVGWALRWGSWQCGSRPWAPPLRVSPLVWLDAGAGLCKWGTCHLFSYLSQSPPDCVLFCSLDDDSDLYSPRYSFSEDSKWCRIFWSRGRKRGWWMREDSFLFLVSLRFENLLYPLFFSSKISPFCASLKKWDELHWRWEGG